MQQIQKQFVINLKIIRGYHKEWIDIQYEDNRLIEIEDRHKIGDTEDTELEQIAIEIE